MGILDDTEIDALVQLTQAHGGYVSYKNNSDGSQSPYELNITYFDAITDPKVTTDQPETAISRFIVSQAIMLSFIGVPGIYFHSLFGSRNYEAGVTETGRYRTINREKLNADQLLVELENSNSIRSRIFSEYCKLLTTRSKEPAFHPLGDQVVLNLHPGVFSVDRISSDKTSRVLALHNISSQSVQLTIPTGDQTIWYNLLDNQLTYTSSESSLVLSLAPYQTVWLKAI
jgi:hypothetical protein